jgi:hypothetical protein
MSTVDSTKDSRDAKQSAKAEARTTVGIVGGGRGGLGILKLLAPLPTVEVVFVVDPSPTAVAILEAKNHRIRTETRMSAVQGLAPNFVVEATGAPAVLQEVTQTFTRSSIIDSKVGLFLFQCFEVENKRLQAELMDLHQQSSANTDAIARVLNNSRQVTMQMKILSINAQIEAARAGDSGRGFSVLAAEMKRLSDGYRESQTLIEQITMQSRKVNECVLSSIAHLAN